jgi:hypothetical protein
MAKRNLYRIEKFDDCCIVYRTDNNYGRQGIVYKDGSIKLEYTPYQIPLYIQKECLNLLNNQ